MKCTTKGVGAALSALLAAALLCTPVLAATQAGGGEEGVGGFYVTARIPANQTDTNLSYFSLMMEPGAEQVLEVEVVNESTEPIEVDVSAVAASTNPNGIIDYKSPNVRDDSLQHDFAELAEVVEASIQIPAGGTGVASVRVTMPTTQFDGALLGGLVFTKRAAEVDMDADENGALIQNVYNYALAVVLRENENVVEPDFELASVDTNLFNNQPAFIHAIRNREPYIVKQMEVTASVYAGDKVQGIPVASRTQELMDMAPNSVLDFAVMPEDGTLEGGTYTTEVVVKLGGKEWRFTDSFMVQDEEATLVNDLAPFPLGANGGTTAAQNSAGGVNVALVVLLVALIAVVAILAIALLARRKRDAARDTYRRR